MYLKKKSYLCRQTRDEGCRMDMIRMAQTAKTVLFRVKSMLWHRLTAWNTGGEGIHSPRLFYLVRYVFGETAQLYAWSTIEQRRQAMLRAPKLIHIKDWGTGQDRDELLMHITKQSTMPLRWAQLLSRVLYHMSGNEYVLDRKRPLRVVELGTHVGLTTAYLAAVDNRNSIDTFEGSEEIAQVAQMNWQKIALTNIQLHLGNIDQTLPDWLISSSQSIDFVLLDANHTYEATLRYFDLLMPYMDNDGVIVVDDIRYSPDMWQAWQTIVHRPKVTATMDLGQMGMVFFYPPLEKKNYKLRV